jgi:uncharacterized protein (TIGR03066 family)
MKLLQSALVACLVLGLAGCGSPTTKPKTTATTTVAPAATKTREAPTGASTNKEKILGTWELVKAEIPKMPPGATVEYTKDGKVIMKAMVKGKEMKMEAAYTVEGDSLTTTGKSPDGKEHKDVDKITKLTATEMELTDKEGKKIEFKKK